MHFTSFYVNETKYLSMEAGRATHVPRNAKKKRNPTNIYVQEPQELWLAEIIDQSTKRQIHQSEHPRTPPAATMKGSLGQLEKAPNPCSTVNKDIVAPYKCM